MATHKQKYVWPDGLFEDVNLGRLWTCARTRPRWEKKFANWLAGSNMPHFLPVFTRETVSYGKHRVTELPVFPGYVFVEGDHTKRVFSDSDCVVRLLKPASEQEAKSLDNEVYSIWQSLQSGLLVEPAQEFSPGEEVEVVNGPLMGTIGHFLRKGQHGTLLISVSMLGAGVTVNLSPDCRVQSIDRG